MFFPVKVLGVEGEMSRVQKFPNLLIDLFLCLFKIYYHIIPYIL